MGEEVGLNVLYRKTPMYSDTLCFRAHLNFVENIYFLGPMSSDRFHLNTIYGSPSFSDIIMCLLRFIEEEELR